MNTSLLVIYIFFLFGKHAQEDGEIGEGDFYAASTTCTTAVPFVHAAAISVDNDTGKDGEMCLQAKKPCRTLSYALLKTCNNVVVHLLSSVTLSTNVSISHCSNISIVGQGRDSTVVQCGWGTNAFNETSVGAGLLLFDVEHFSMKNLTMSSCGTLHVTSRMHQPKQCGNISTFRASLFMHSSSYITIDNVSINSSNGVGLAMLNTNHSVHIVNCVFFNNSGDLRYQNFSDKVKVNGGGGIHLQLSSGCRPRMNVIENSTFIIKNCKFIHNKKQSLSLMSSKMNTSSGGGLLIMLFNISVPIYVSIKSCAFIDNTAEWGGGMCISVKHTNHSNITVTDSTIEGNSADSNLSKHLRKRGGGGGVTIGIYTFNYTAPPMHNHIIFRHCTIYNNTALYGAGTNVFTNIGLRCNNSLTFENCSWIRNTAKTISAAVDISPNSLIGSNNLGLVPTFQDCSFIRNSVYVLKAKESLHDSNFYFSPGTFVATSIHVTFKGNTKFQDNSATALQLISTVAQFSNGSNVLFRNNTGIKGGAVALIGMSYFQFDQDSIFDFINNMAEDVGGAIYYYSINPHDYIRPETCFLKYQKSNTNVSGHNVTFNFSGNRALSKFGHSIFATTLSMCVQCRGEQAHKTEVAINMLNCCVARFRFDNNHTLEAITTLGTNVIVNDTVLSASPGKSLHLDLAIFDELGNDVTSNTVLRAEFLSNGSTNQHSLQYIVTGNIELVGEPGQNGSVTLRTTDACAVPILLNVSLTNCPPGFDYLNSTGKCTCIAPKYYGLRSCRSDLLQSWILRGFWIGYLPDLEASPSTLMTSLCPIGYCTYDNKFDLHIVLLPSTASREQLSEFVCSEGRSGILCGACSKNHSVYYHSSSKKCVEDSGSCKLGILFFILSDLMPVTIVFFIVLFFNISFTSGAMNGFILFAQVVDLMNTNANGLIPFPKAKYLILASELIYGFFDLYISNDEISYCIWKGAGTLDVLVIRYVAIVYALLLVLLLVFIMNHCGCYCICRCIHRQSFKSSIIQGLSAFLVMCYAQCARVTFMILQPGFLKGKGHKIMYDKVVVHFSGNIEYFGSEHQPYALIAVVFLITFVLLPPIILLTNSILIQILSYCHCKNTRVVNVVLMTRFKPLLDSFQGCFKDSCRCFASIYFFYRIGFLLLHATFPVAITFYILTEIALIILIGVHAIVQPYQQKWHNTLDILLFINLALINGITIYIYTGNIIWDAAADTKVFQWVQILLIYLPILCVAGRVIVGKVRSLCQSFNKETDYVDIDDDEDSLPARLLSDQFNKYNSIDN